MQTLLIKEDSVGTQQLTLANWTPEMNKLHSLNTSFVCVCVF